LSTVQNVRFTAPLRFLSSFAGGTASKARQIVFRRLTVLFFPLLFLLIHAPEFVLAQPPGELPFSKITLLLEGKPHQLQNPLILKDGITYAPFREIFTILGAKLGHTYKYGRLLVWAELEGHRFLLERDSTAFYHNDMLLSLPGAPPVIEGSLYFPLRFLLDQAGYRVHWETVSAVNNDEPLKAQIYLYPPLAGQMVEAELIDSTTNAENNASAAAGAKAPQSTRFNPPALRVPVLMYHHLAPEEEYDGRSGTTISVEAFAEQMDYLFAAGYRTVTLEDLYLFITGQKQLPPKTVVLTFDDGYASNYHYAYPILKQYHFRAVVFPITGKVNFWVPRLTEEMMEQSADVFEFHSHSHNLHYYIDGKQALLYLNHESVREDLRHSRELLDCFAFSYPYGAFNEETIEMLKESGYKMAFTIIPGYVCPGDDPFRLNRFGIFPETGLKDFIRLLEQFK